MKDEKQALINATVQRLKEQGIPHAVQPGGTHIIVLGPDGQRIDLWPTTLKWMWHGMPAFWEAVSSWGTDDGA